MTMTIAPPRATLDDLMRTEGKAELINGKVVSLMASGYRHNIVAGDVYSSLKTYAKTTGRGIAFTDSMGFAVAEMSSGRESFSPDASYYTGPAPDDEQDFVAGVPDFAVEVRGKSDRGPAAEAAMAAKRDDYFEAGTLVVWDIDLDAKTVTSYRLHEPEPLVFASGTEAHAEPAVPGWRIAVDELMS